MSAVETADTPFTGHDPIPLSVPRFADPLSYLSFAISRFPFPVSEVMLSTQAARPEKCLDSEFWRSIFKGNGVNPARGLDLTEEQCLVYSFHPGPTKNESGSFRMQGSASMTPNQRAAIDSFFQHFRPASVDLWIGDASTCGLANQALIQTGAVSTLVDNGYFLSRLDSTFTTPSQRDVLLCYAPYVDDPNEAKVIFGNPSSQIDTYLQIYTWVASLPEKYDRLLRSVGVVEKSNSQYNPRRLKTEIY